VASRRKELGPALVAAVLIAWAALYAYLATIEPPLHDGWWHVLEHRQHAFSPSSLVDFVRRAYVQDNPRLGQWLTFVAYAPGGWHPLLAAIGMIATTAGVFVLAFARWPATARDAGRLAIIAGLSFVCVPNPGQMFCYLPFTGNYVWAFAVTLALVVPYRLALAGRTPPSGIARVLGMFVLGVAAGMANEHTGPVAIAAIAAALVLLRRRDGHVSPWALAGLVGIVAGTALLLGAPGQLLRYHGLAEQSSLLANLVDRGVAGNLMVIAMWLLYTCGAWLALGGALVATRRRPAARWWLDVAVLVALAFAIVLTVLFSPKQGPRLFYAPAILLLAAAVRALDEATAPSRRATTIATIIGGAIAIGGGAWLVHIQRDMHADAVARDERMIAAAPGTIVAVPPFRHFDPTWWTFGDDDRSAPLRQHVARRLYGLDDVTLATADRALLGRAGVTLALELDPPDPRAIGVADPDGDGFSDQVFTIPGIAAAKDRFHAAIAALRVLPAPPRRVGLRVVGVDAPALGGRPLYFASWDPAGGLREATGDDTIAVPSGAWLVRAGDDATPIGATGGRSFLEVVAGAPSGGYFLVTCDAAACHVVSAHRR
jgi:hypothetical protein